MRNDDLTLNERIEAGLTFVQTAYANALLCVADGNSLKPTNDPNDIRNLRIVCADMSADQTIITRELTPGLFGPCQVLHKPWTTDVPIAEPGSVMDIAQAQKAKESAGYSRLYTKIELRNPDNDPPTNPFFIFKSFGKKELVFVDVITGEVHAE